MANNEKRHKMTDDAEVFDEMFLVLHDDLTKQNMKDEEISDAIKWFKKVINYNVPHGKKNRGLTVVHSYRYLNSNATAEDLKVASVLGWCIEWLQAFFLVADDIMDNSVTRRGQPCWYKNPGVGLTAINDAFYLESAVYVILKKYFREKPYYACIMDLFHETTMQTITGQCLDLLSAPPGKVDFSSFTPDRYKAIVKWKTAYYSFYLPVAAAMIMHGIQDQELYGTAQTILLQMGEFFQVQDDFLDCYGDPETTGKVGTDIEDNKCGWLIVQALTLVTPLQLCILQDNYAQNDPAKVARVKAVYKELNLQKLYDDYEETCYNDLTVLINKLSSELPKEMFIAYANKIFKRQK